MILLYLCIILPALALLFEIWRETHTFVLRKYEVLSPKIEADFQGIKVVFLSDLHNKVYGEHNEKLISAVKHAEPDLIFVGGDMIISSSPEIQPAIELMKALSDTAPVWAANGNHEQRIRRHPERYELSYEGYRSALTGVGINFLENRSERIYLYGQMFRITGLEIPIKCYRRFYRGGLSSEEVERVIGPGDKEIYEVLLAHNPMFMESYLERGADLILSGHIHGGIVGTPQGGILSPGFHLFPRFCAGLHMVKETAVVVSRGMGNHTINMRLFNPAELIVITVKGKKVPDEKE